jgi:hypothetical protein
MTSLGLHCPTKQVHCFHVLREYWQRGEIPRPTAVVIAHVPNQVHLPRVVDIAIYQDYSLDYIRPTKEMATRVTGLIMTTAARLKLARHGVEEWEPQEVGWDHPRFFRNKRIELLLTR